MRDLVRGLITAAELFAAPAAAFFFFCFLPGFFPAGVIFFSAAECRYTLVVGSGSGADVLPFAAFFRGKPRVVAAFAWWYMVCESCELAIRARVLGRYRWPLRFPRGVLCRLLRLPRAQKIRALVDGHAAWFAAAAMRCAASIVIGVASATTKAMSAYQRTTAVRRPCSSLGSPSSRPTPPPRPCV